MDIIFDLGWIALLIVAVVSGYRVAQESTGLLVWRRLAVWSLLPFIPLSILFVIYQTIAGLIGGASFLAMVWMAITWLPTFWFLIFLAWVPPAYGGGLLGWYVRRFGRRYDPRRQEEPVETIYILDDDSGTAPTEVGGGAR